MSVLRLDATVAAEMRARSGSGADPCYQCGTCTATCPLGLSARRIVRAAQLGMPGAATGVYSCTTCAACEARCPREVPIVRVVQAHRQRLMASQQAPKGLERALWGVYEEGNHWGGSRAQRGSWARDLQAKDASKGVDVLLYVGCASSFDPRLQRVAQGALRLLQGAGVDVGVLGHAEPCCGDVVQQTGEDAFLEELVATNVKLFASTGASTVVALSPHCSTMFADVYPRYGAAFETAHLTQLLARLYDEGRLVLRRGASGTLTYHDPCYLSRRHKETEAPRKLLEAIAPQGLVELEDRGVNTLCCGGGGGQMWLEDGGKGPHGRLSHQRLAQVDAVGAQTVATACPYCVQNLEDAARATGRAGAVAVRDVTELVAANLVPSA